MAAILLAIVIVFGGFFALSYQSQAVEDPAVANGTNASADAYNMTNAVFDDFGTFLAEGMVWLGVAAVVLLAAAMAVSASRGGR